MKHTEVHPFRPMRRPNPLWELALALAFTIPACVVAYLAIR